ncbi:hypothetical protein CSOJ01_12049 [Colletotrichum sojae]|uniref:Uncharacterized protein n=1 Tax=Colletotrichum sojae TaxID=2175907 RepID=A0A8H6MMV7_9PEZI|nr:hypothetical protein CSOJ01_12049 [Colletotrichum sojae]
MPARDETSGQGSRPVPSLAVVAAARDLECLGLRTSLNVAVVPKGQVVNESMTGGVRGLPGVSPPVAGTVPRHVSGLKKLENEGPAGLHRGAPQPQAISPPRPLARWTGWMIGGAQEG